MIEQNKLNKYLMIGQIGTFVLLVLLLLCMIVFFRLKERTPAPALPIPAPFNVSSAHLDHDHVLEFIVQHEGSHVRQEPNGTISKYGISQPTWNAFRNRQGDKVHLPQSVREINDKGIIKRFYYDYLDRFHTWELHHSLQLIYADMAVLSGSEAVRIIQHILGLEQDGVWGRHTTAGVKHLNGTISNSWQSFNDFDTYKRDYLKDLARHPKYAKELKGWLLRADDLSRYMEQILVK